MQKPSRPPHTPLRLGTRGSPLALAQAHMTMAALRAHHGWDEGAIEIVVVQTSGDRIQDRALAEIGGKALWTKELDRALISGEIDIIEQPPPDLFPMLKKDKNLALFAWNPLGSQIIMRMNFLHPPFDNIKARQAAM